METPIGREQVLRFTEILKKYKAGKAATEARIRASEQWWKLRNAQQEGVARHGGFVSSSGWLHNVIASKHADAMQAMPEPVILPREPDDQAQARLLSAVVPCILEQNGFESTYSDEQWQKCKTGTGVYKVVWDPEKLGGMGDVAIECVSLLDLYWQPGVRDIQRSRYFFHTELCDREALCERWPELQGRLRGSGFLPARFLYDDQVDVSDQETVVEVYYRRGGLLHYCKYVGDTVLFASENDPEMQKTGFYAHGRYPYVFDPLFPVEGSPCGYGYVDICKNPQTAIDLMDTAFVENAMAGSVPRFFRRADSSVNEEQFLDLRKRLVDVSGNIDETGIRPIDFHTLPPVYVSYFDRKIQELRETSGNTETATGGVQSGVTAASAIVALQEASGKGSRDSTMTSYRAFRAVVELTLWLIRQFYDLPRSFRITGRSGQAEFITYSNAALQAQTQTGPFGTSLRLPVFDIVCGAQKKSAYTKASQNELALQFFRLGFFEPTRAPQALRCLEMMDFDGREALMERLREGAGLTGASELAALLGTSELASLLDADGEGLLGAAGDGAPASGEASGADGPLPQGDSQRGLAAREPKRIERARRRAQEAPVP